MVRGSVDCTPSIRPGWQPCHGPLGVIGPRVRCSIPIRPGRITNVRAAPACARPFRRRNGLSTAETTFSWSICARSGIVNSKRIDGDRKRDAIANGARSASSTTGVTCSLPGRQKPGPYLAVRRGGRALLPACRSTGRNDATHPGHQIDARAWHASGRSALIHSPFSPAPGQEGRRDGYRAL